VTAYNVKPSILIKLTDLVWEQKRADEVLNSEHGGNYIEISLTEPFTEWEKPSYLRNE
jgi:hypothetical protein